MTLVTFTVAMSWEKTIIRYLESLPAEKKVGGVVFVAGWFTLTNVETEEEKRIGKPWIENPIDFQKVTSHTKHFVAIFSDDDDVVPVSNKNAFEEKLGAATILEHGKGHFSGGDGITELPSALEAIVKMSQ